MTRPRTLRIPLAALALCAATHLAHAEPDDGGTPLASVRVSEFKTLPGLPAGAPQAVFYSATPGHGDGMSCGLLARGAKGIVALVEPGEDGAWPTCLGIPAATSFDWKGVPILVYRYLQRDTLEDTYTYDAFLQMGPEGLGGVDGLVPDDEPKDMGLTQAAGWAKASLTAGDAAAAGFAASARDTVLAERGFLAVGRNAGDATCRLDAGRLAAGGAPAPLTTPCQAILATSALATPRADWLIALLQRPGGQTEVRVFEAGATHVREATEMEPRLAAAAGGGQVLAVKAELKRLLAR